MSITSFFRDIGAPLANSRWSWGATDERKQRVFVRAWQDQTKADPDGTRWIRLAHHGHYASDQKNLGYRERLRHLEMLKSGIEGYVVMCLAVNPSDRPRTIKSFNRSEVFLLGEIKEIDGDEWAELVCRVPVKDL